MRISHLGTLGDQGLIFFLQPLRRPLPEQCLCSSWSWILPALVHMNSFIFWEIHLPEYTGQIFQVTQGRNDGRIGVLAYQVALRPSIYHSENLLCGWYRSTPTTLRDSFPCAPCGSFVLEKRELGSDLNFVWKSPPIFIFIKKKKKIYIWDLALHSCPTERPVKLPSPLIFEV